MQAIFRASVRSGKREQTETAEGKNCMSQTAGKWLQRIVHILFFAVLIWLTVTAAGSTAVIPPREGERTYLVQDSVWVNLLYALLFSIFLLIYAKDRIQRIRRLPELEERKIKKRSC